jgi:hypothetical protein
MHWRRCNLLESQQGPALVVLEFVVQLGTQEPEGRCLAPLDAGTVAGYRHRNLRRRNWHKPHMDSSEQLQEHYRSRLFRSYTGRRLA